MPSLPMAMCPSRMDILAHILMREQTLHQCVRLGWTPCPQLTSPATFAHATESTTDPTLVCPSRMDTFHSCHTYHMCLCPWQCVHPGSHTKARTNSTSVCPSRMDTLGSGNIASLPKDCVHLQDGHTHSHTDGRTPFISVSVQDGHLCTQGHLSTYHHAISAEGTVSILDGHPC